MFVARHRRVRSDLDRVDQGRERPFGVDRGHHRARRDLGAVGEGHAGRAVPLDRDLHDLGRRSDLGAEPRAALASASASAPGRPARSSTARRAPRRSRPSRRAAPPSCPPTRAPSPCTARPGGDRAPERVALERLRDVVGDRHREGPRGLPAGLRPRRRNAFPSFTPFSASASDGLLHVGRGDRVQVGEERRERADLRVERRVRLGVRSERSRSSDAVRAASDQSVSGGPSGCGANTRTSGSTVTRPCCTSPRSWITDLRRRPTVCTIPGARTPGAISTVSRIPPTRSRRSRTSTLRPAFARYAAVTRPLWPAPTIDGVVARRHATLPFPEPSCRRSSSAAIRPGAPMIPPPGCVAEPHIHRSLIGVR